jgi:hypothetical protein
MEGTEQSGDKLQREAEESIDRVRRDFDKLAEWILLHQLPKENDSPQITKNE